MRLVEKVRRIYQTSQQDMWRYICSWHSQSSTSCTDSIQFTVVEDRKGQDILALLRAGDERGINMLFATYFAPLCQVAFRIVHNQQAAKDVVQDVFVKLWSNREKIHIQTSVLGYLKQSVTNASIDNQRRAYEARKVQWDASKGLEDATVETATAHVEHDVEAKETAALVERAIAELPERCRLVFILSRQQGLSYKQIAEKLEISPKTVENQMSKALKTLRKTLSSVLTIGLLLHYYLFFFNAP